MSPQPVNIQIFGRTIRVNCPPEEKEALHQAAIELEERLQALKIRTNVHNNEQLLIIAALNICHELAQERIQTQSYTSRMEKRIRLLKQTIEQALSEQKNNRQLSGDLD